MWPGIALPLLWYSVPVVSLVDTSTHPPPSIPESIIPFQNLNLLTGSEFQLIAVLRDEGMHGANENHTGGGRRWLEYAKRRSSWLVYG